MFLHILLGLLLLPPSFTLTPLPPNISPYSPPNPSATSSSILDMISGVVTASRGELRKIEIEFPPLLLNSKSTFDDYDNIQELDANKDFTVKLASYNEDLKRLGKSCWLLYPDLKELETTSLEFPGKTYKICTATTLESSTQHFSPNYLNPWGVTASKFVSGLIYDKSKTTKTSLGDTSYLPDLNSTPEPEYIIAIQPGNGGPVEDWINLSTLTSSCDSAICIINGALDKVKSSYYPDVFFPKLAKVKGGYEEFESGFYLKAVSDKGVFGWLFRVWPEEWQVVKQTKVGEEVIDEIVWSGDARPNYQETVDYLLKG
ncbi:hypothetical protein TrLO_g5747 [Triparma laevis f. longispina]|uniref:DUF1995 domain-containing protein n=1 Tax=Triparma laevis f. longispina TaxID=1714387 RepID=A0A9W7FH12_9STRA|nr:hypothetical protein TrLO_g5747 [Triparma laevis f. longispina]